MRPPAELVAGEPVSPLQRLMACVDSASGASACLDPADWGFLNTELTVHVLRPPVGDWVCLDAATTLGTGSVGLATSSVHDELGLVARSARRSSSCRGSAPGGRACRGRRWSRPARPPWASQKAQVATGYSTP
jgi:hypothetical protein